MFSFKTELSALICFDESNATEHASMKHLQPDLHLRDYCHSLIYDYASQFFNILRPSRGARRTGADKLSIESNDPDKEYKRKQDWPLQLLNSSIIFTKSLNR